MKIYQIISERKIVSEGRFSWLDDTYKWLRGFTKAGKEAERIAKELEYLAPGIDKAAEKYADMVTKAREEFKKPPSIDFFLRQTVPNWANRVPEEQEAIKQALMTATKSKIAEREAAKTAGKNQQTTPSSQQTPPAPTPNTTTNTPSTNQKPPKQNTKKQTKTPGEPSWFIRTHVGKVEFESTLQKVFGNLSGWLAAIGIFKILWEAYQNLVHYQELSELPPDHPHHVSAEQLPGFRRQVIFQALTKIAGALGAFKVGQVVGGNIGGLLELATKIGTLGVVKGSGLGVLGALSGEVAATVVVRWLEQNPDAKELLAWTVWNLVDPTVVKIADMSIYEGVIGKLLQDIEAAKAKEGGDTSAPAPAPNTGAQQSGQETPSGPGAQHTPTPSSPNNVAPITQPSADYSDDERRDAWNRLLQYK